VGFVVGRISWGRGVFQCCFGSLQRLEVRGSRGGGLYVVGGGGVLFPCGGVVGAFSPAVRGGVRFRFRKSGFGGPSRGSPGVRGGSGS